MGAQHCSIHLTVLYDEYSMGGAFDVPTQNTINEYPTIVCLLTPLASKTVGGSVLHVYSTWTLENLFSKLLRLLCIYMYMYIQYMCTVYMYVCVCIS